MPAEEKFRRRRAISASAAEALERRVLFAYASPVRDINQTADHVDPQGFTAAAGVGYFAGQPAVGHGPELFRTNGTPFGTRLVRDINPGLPGSEPRSLTNVSGTLFFTATEPSGGRELYRSDGTAEGTVRVRDIRPGTASSNPANLTAVNGTLYFAAADGVSGVVLWKSDGTEAGTVRVANVSGGAGPANPQSMVNYNGVLLFVAAGSSGSTLYRADASGVAPVSGAPRDPRSLVLFNNAVYFSGSSSILNSGDLFRTDGTAAGTTLVKQIDYGSSTDLASTGALTPSGGLLYFRSGDVTTGRYDLWRSDGTEAGTFTVLAGAALTTAHNLTPAGASSVVFARTTAAQGLEPWVSDGSVAGTALLKDLAPGAASGLGETFLQAATVLGVLYFAPNGVFGAPELWRTDLTSAGTLRVRAVPGAGGYIHGITRFFDGMVFASTRIAGEGDLYWSNGTAAETIRIGSAPGNASSMFDYWTSISQAPAFFRDGEVMYFAADDGLLGSEMWRAGPGGEVPFRVADLAPGGASSEPADFTRGDDGSIYFAAATPAAGRELYRFPPGGGTPQLVRDVFPGAESSFPRDLSPAGGALYFGAGDAADSGELLWRYEAATGSLTKLTFGPFNDPLRNPWKFVRVGGYWYFSARLGFNSDSELWRTDGTPGGLRRMSDVYGGSRLSNPGDLTAIGDMLFFTAQDQAAGRELWKTDGTAAGTVRIADLQPGSASSDISYLYAHRGVLYFSLSLGNGTGGLWRSDGTAAGTFRVEPLDAPRQFASQGEQLYFVASDAQGRSAYRTDGTPGAAVRLTDPGSGDGAFQASGLHLAGGRAYVVGLGGNEARFELWVTDGSPGGGRRVLEIHPRVTATRLSSYWSIGWYAMGSNSTHLYFPGYRPEWGLEPHRLPLSEPPGSVSGTVYDDRNRNGVRNAGEPALAGRTVFIDYEGDGLHDADEPYSTTGTNGAYTITGLEPGAYTVRQVLSDGRAQTDPAGGFGRVVTVAQQAVTGVDFGSSDVTGPFVSTSAFDFAATPVSVRVVFSEDVGGTLVETDLQVLNLTTNAPVPPQSVRLSYDGASRTGTFTFPGYPGGVLPNGNYRATLAAGSVADASGNASGSPHVLEFFVLAGDINRDRTVNGTDFALLAGSFGKTGMTFAQGDLNGDASVNGTDFAILAANFGKSVPVVQAAGAGAALLTDLARTGAAGRVQRRPTPTRRSANGRGRSARAPGIHAGHLV